jgi:spermidine/putrescine transport system ATP-binding protein
LTRAALNGSSGAEMTGGALSLRHLVKDYDTDSRAVDDLSLEIAGGEFFTLLGESGCGKTTTLRMIAGFEEPTAGEILLDSDDLTQVAPHKRPVNTVFQSYALFPFMTVRENVAFGMTYTGLGKRETQNKVNAALELVEMGTLAKRKPHQLSGGQQQRVALARALVLQPRVLLLDEPLGALDARLRKQLQRDLRALQQAVQTTFVYVTHDQDEALTMSDRIAVIVSGRVAQIGTPAEIYSRPQTAYVASFLGNANLLPAEVITTTPTLRCRHGTLDLDANPDGQTFTPGDRTTLMIRPERVLLNPPNGTTGTDRNRLVGTVSGLSFHGARTLTTITGNGWNIDAETTNNHAHKPEWLTTGHQIHITLPTDALRAVRH